MFFLLQVPLFQWAVILVILFVLGIHFKFLQDISPPILSFILLFILFLTALKISSLVLIGFFTCFFILITHAGLWLAAVCYVALRLQWVALSALWVWALPPQAHQPLAGCTGAFPGQVPSTTCVTPHLSTPPPKNSWCSIFLLTCTTQQSASTFFNYIPWFIWVRWEASYQSHICLLFLVRRLLAKRRECCWSCF